MIYYNDTLVSSKDTPEIYPEITRQKAEIRADYFAEGKRGFVRLLYPKGRAKQNNSMYWEPRKPFLVPLISGDGMYRFSEIKPHVDPNTKAFKFTESHKMIKDGDVFYENDIEFIWLLFHHSREVEKGILVIENPEAIAKEKNETKAEDIDLRYYLFGKSSPLNGKKGTESLNSLADAIGITDSKIMGEEELRYTVFETFTNGEKNKDPIVNFNNFMDLTHAENKRRALITARTAIASGKLRFDRSLYAWRLDGEEDIFLKLTGAQQGQAESLVLEKIIEDPIRRIWLFDYMGEEQVSSISELESIKRPNLLQLAKKFKVDIDKKDSNPDLVRKIADKIAITDKVGI